MNTETKLRTETYVIVRSDGALWGGWKRFWIHDLRKANTYRTPETCSRAIAGLPLPKGYTAGYLSPDEINQD